MSDILVSIIIPVYHSEATLPLCLEAINNQEFDLLEVIIVDSESSADIQLLARIQNAKYLNITNNNIASKRNHGASLAQGKILLFLDADCLLPPSFFESLWSIFQNQEVVAAGCHDFNLPLDAHWINFAWQVHLQVWSTHNTAWVPTRCLAVRGESFNLIKGFNEKLITCEDVDLGYRLNNYGKIENTDLLKITHLLNPMSLGQFFLKELWHGFNSFSISIKNRSRLKETIYLLIPVYFLLLGCSVMLAGYLLAFKLSFAGVTLLIGMLTPFFGMSFYTTQKSQQLKYFPTLSLAYLIYLLARGAATFKLNMLHSISLSTALLFFHW